MCANNKKRQLQEYRENLKGMTELELCTEFDRIMQQLRSNYDKEVSKKVNRITK